MYIRRNTLMFLFPGGVREFLKEQGTSQAAPQMSPPSYSRLNRMLLLYIFTGLRYNVETRNLMRKGWHMLIVLVYVHVKDDCIEEFREASLRNAENSVREPGVARFDIIQQKDDPSRFALVEVYRNEEAPAKHKETAHYNKWREIVESMMAEPRSSCRYVNVFPDEGGW